MSASTDNGPLLTFRLAAKDAQVSRSPGEVGFHIELSGLQTGSRAKPLYWTFRQDPFGQKLGDNPVPVLLREIELRIGGQDYTALIRDVLSQVPIAHDGRLWMDPLGWVLPHRSVDLCMDRDSLLRIEAAVPSGVGPMVHPFHARAATHFDPPGPTDIESYRGRLFGKDTKEAITQEVGLGNLARTQPNTVKVKGIYVEEYMSLAPCGTGTSADSLAPDNQDFRRPGGGS
jgi:hypothetical protein